MMVRVTGILAMVGMAGGFLVPVVPRVVPLMMMRATAPSAATGENDVKLAELIFSSGDPRVEVAMAPHEYGDEFCNFVLAKADVSDDMEERVALKSLVEMIKQVHVSLEQAADEVEDERVQEEEELVRRDSAADILSAATAAVGTATPSGVAEKEEVVEEAGLSGEALATYDALLTKLVRADADGVLETEVEANYETCDYSLLTLANARRNSAEDPTVYERVVGAVNALAAKRLEKAASRLQSILRAGAPEKMMQKVTELAATGQPRRASG